LFLSYRREDASGHAGRLYDALTGQFPPEQVFMDIDTIEPGVDYVEVVEEAVGSCDVLLAVIGQRWLQATGETGAPRVQDEHDLVRLEIEAALSRKIRVIPVLVQDSRLPSAEEMPEGLRALARRHAIAISDHRWHYDVEQLVRVLERIRDTSNSDASMGTGLSTPPPPTGALEVAPGQREPPSSAQDVGITGVGASRAGTIPDEGGMSHRLRTQRSTRGMRLRWWAIGAVGISALILSFVLLGLFVFSKPSNSSITPTGITIDGVVTVTGEGSQTTPVLYATAASNLLVAMVSTEYQESVSVSGGGLSWKHFVRYVGTNTTAGQNIEVWTAWANGTHSKLTVTSSMAGPSPWLQSLTVMALKGAAGLGAISKGCFSGSGCTSEGPIPSVSVTPRYSGSMVMGVGYDYSDKFVRLVTRGQTLDQQAFDPTERATMWVQHANSLTNAGLPVTISDAAAANDDWALTAFEIVPRHR